jgi:hypothetical protein
MTGDKTMTTTGLEILERCYESGYRAYQAKYRSPPMPIRQKIDSVQSLEGRLG